jgi:hypothetical protein
MRKRRQPFTPLKKTPEQCAMKTKDTIHNPGERAAAPPPVASFRAGSGAKEKKALGVGVIP